MMVRNTTSLHETTVQKAAMKAVPNYKPKKRKAPRSKTSAVSTRQAIDPAIIKWMKKNNVKYSQIEVESATVIVIRK